MSIWNHNVNPPVEMPEDSGFVRSHGDSLAYTEQTPEDILNTYGLYRAGEDDPIPEGHEVVTERRVVSGGKSILVRTTRELPSADEAGHLNCPRGIETPSIIWPRSPERGHDWESFLLDGVVVTNQISASPRKSKAEREEIKEARKTRILALRDNIAGQIEAIKDKNAKAAVQSIAELLNLI